jgi:hypothetical protein
MFVVFQVPLADSRRFIPEGSYSLGHFEPPDVIDRWSEESDSEGEASRQIGFTRAFGSIHQRIKGGTRYWDNENYFGQARRAVRFKPWLGNNFPLGLDSSKSHIQWVSRRLFRSNATARLEIDFKLSHFPADVEEFKKTLTDVLDLPVRIPHIDKESKSCVDTGEISRKLKYVGADIGLRLLYSTTKHGGNPEKWWISAGEPFLVIELDKGYLSSLPKEAQIVYRFGRYGIDLYYYKLSFGKYPNQHSVDVWILACSSTIDAQRCLREIRINVSRYITERKCLQIILLHITDERIKFEPHTLNGQALQDYLKESFDLIGKGKGLELEKQTREKLLIQVIAYTDSLVHPGVYPTLLQKLKKVRRTLFNQIMQVVEKQTSSDAVKNFYFTTYHNKEFIMSQNKGNVHISDVKRDVIGVAAGENLTMTGVAFGAISGYVSNTINQLPASSDPNNPGIKELLAQLQAAIEAESELPEEDKTEALEQVKILAEAGQKPGDNVLKKTAKTSMKILKGTVASLPDAAKLAESCVKLLPAITALLALV